MPITGPTLSVPPSPNHLSSNNSSRAGTPTPDFKWKTVSSDNEHVWTVFQMALQQEPSIKNAVDTLSQQNIKVKLSLSNTKPSPEELTESFSIENAAAGLSLHITQSEPSRSSSGKTINILCVPTNIDNFAHNVAHNISGKELASTIDYALQGALQWNKTGECPPIFAILSPPKPVQNAVLKHIEKLPIEVLLQFDGTLVHDLTGTGFSPYHANIGEKLVAPLATVKVRQGETRMVQHALERFVQPGYVLYIDGGGQVSNDDRTYALAGDMMLGIALKHKVPAFVIDAYMRDRKGYKSIAPDFQVWARGLTPNGPTKLGPGAIHLPVKGQGYTANTNDIYVSDGHHLLIIPAEKAYALRSATTDRNKSHPHFFKPGETYSVQDLQQRRASLFPKSTPLVPQETRITTELLDHINDVPPPEWSDSFHSGPKGAVTTGASRSRSDKSPVDQQATGVALTAEGTFDSVATAILRATPKTALVIDAKAEKQVVLNESLLHAAEEQGIPLIVANGTVDLGNVETTPILIHAQHFINENRSMQAGFNPEAPVVTMGKVSIHSGDIVTADPDGIVAFPTGWISHGLRGGHDIGHREGDAREFTKTASPEELQKKYRPMPDLLHPSTDQADAESIYNQIDRQGPYQGFPRGSSGLFIPAPTEIRTAPISGSTAPANFNDKTSQTLTSGNVISGVPTELIIPPNAAPLVFKITPDSNAPEGEEALYVSGIAEEHFVTAMAAKEQKLPITITSEGETTIASEKPSSSLAKRKTFDARDLADQGDDQGDDQDGPSRPKRTKTN